MGDDAVVVASVIPLTRCYGTYRISWDGPLVPCGRKKGHNGPHGPDRPPMTPKVVAR